MDVVHSSIEKKFYINDSDNNLIAEMTYTHAGNTMIIVDHTWVDEKYKGQGLGKILMDSVSDFARSNSIKIVPLCPFTKMLFEKFPEKYADTLSQ